jgi:hypothetical protein
MSLNKRLINVETTVPIDNFNAVLYTGSNSSLEVANGFQADLIWTKCRNVGHHWGAFDSVTGVRQYLTLNNNTSQSEGNGAGNYGVETFGSSSTTFYGARGRSNSGYLSGTYVGYFWRAGGSAVSNTSGSITSSVSASTSRGISVVKYTGNGSNGTVGHGLGSTPEIIIVKRLDSSGNWSINGNAGGLSYGTNKLLFNSSAGLASDTNEVTSANSTTFTAGTSGSVGSSGAEYVAYCFRSISGYVDIGSYTGTGAYGHAITTGFEPGMVIIKSTNTSENWSIFDSARGGNIRSYINSSGTEESGTEFAFSSTGFVLPKWGSMNGSGATFMYMAFKIN